MEICFASSVMKKDFPPLRKPEFGNRVEHWRHGFSPEGSTQRLSAQHFRSILEGNYHLHLKRTIEMSE